MAWKKVGYMLARRMRGDLHQDVEEGTMRGGTLNRFGRHLIGQQLTGVEQDVTEASAIQRYSIGAKLKDADRTFHYGHVGISGGYGVTVQPTQLALGYGVATNIWAATDENNVVGAAGGVAGAFTIPYVATGNIAVNQFQGGYICMAGASYGVSCKILSHAAILAAATGTLYLENPLPAAVAAGTACALYASPFYNVMSPLQAGGEATADPNTNQWSMLGVALVAALAGQFCWVETRGPAFVVGAGGAEGTNPGERELVWDVGDGSVQLAAAGATVNTWQHAGFIIPVTNSAVALPAVGVPGGPDGMMYIYLEGAD